MHKSCPHLFPTSAAVQVQACVCARSFPPGPAALFVCTPQTLHKARLLFQQTPTRGSHAETHVHSHSRKTRIDSLPCLIAPHPLSLSLSLSLSHTHTHTHTPSPCRRCIAPILVENKLAQHGNVRREEKRARRLPSPGMQRRCVPLKRAPLSRVYCSIPSQRHRLMLRTAEDAGEGGTAREKSWTKQTPACIKKTPNPL